MTNPFVEILQPCAIVSLVLSGLVVFTAIIFPSLVRNRVFMQLVLLISICDIFGVWPYSLGHFPSSESALCGFEGFCNLFFFPASWILTSIFTILLRDLAMKGSITMSRPVILFIGFGFPTLCCIFMQTTNTFGSEDDQQLKACSFSGKSSSGDWWHYVTYDGLYFFCVAVMLVALMQLSIFEYYNPSRTLTPTYKVVKRTLILYPLAILICWLPHSFCNLNKTCNGNPLQQAEVDIPKVLHGGIVSIIFFVMSREVRRRYVALFRYLLNRSLGQTTVSSLGVGSIEWASESSVLDVNFDDDALVFSLNRNTSSTDADPQRDSSIITVEIEAVRSTVHMNSHFSEALI